MRSAKNLYYPESTELTWLVKLTHSCSYIGLGYNGRYYNFKGVDWVAKDVFFVLMPNKYYPKASLTRTGWQSRENNDL
jgi:hypothetical protein